MTLKAAKSAFTLLAVMLAGLAQGPANAAPASLAAPMPPQIPVGLLVDLSTGQTLFAREPERRFVPASVTKVMTAFTAFKLASTGKLPLERRFIYTSALADQWYNEGSTMFLVAGERPTVAQLLLGVTTVSGNDASEALALAAVGSRSGWLALMNDNARALGMANTHFGSPNGYPDGGATYTTARDLIVLAKALTQTYPGLYRRFFGHRQLTWRGITQDNHDPFTGQIEGGDGIKTGFTAEAGFTFLGSAERGGRRLAVALAAAPSQELRDSAARALVEWGFGAFEQRTLIASGAKVGVAKVQNGTSAMVDLRAPKDLIAALPRDGQARRVTLAIRYRGPVRAPIAEGEAIAMLALQIDGQESLEIPLEAAQSVSEAGIFQRIGNGLRGWF